MSTITKLAKKEKQDRDKTACFEFFTKLAEMLPDYKIVEGCTKGVSTYLVPSGTEDQITWYGKPVGSFRVSHIWNWYANPANCDAMDVVQCESVDMPEVRDRTGEDRGSVPWKGYQVAYYGKDGVYHHVFGVRYDRKLKRWFWNAYTTPEDVITMVKYAVI